MPAPKSIRGDLRRLPAPFFQRLLEVLFLVMFVRTTLEVGARLLLRYRVSGTLELHANELRLDVSHQLLGRTVSRASRSLVLSEVSEIALEEKGEDPRFSIGLGALFVGTALGAGLLTHAAATTSGSLLLLAAAVMAIGLAFDYFAGSGRVPTHLEPAAQIIVQPRTRGFRISGIAPGDGRAFLDATRLHLSSNVAHESADTVQTPLPSP